ncbi:MAG: 2-oxoacid:ferredoxin oxidoreductase subunit beta [bacterium]|uniref:2-oxoglutarate ferredoxin oxidoreductase, beta subunit n=2 Tax=Bacteria candidate phyla TaxID=1783234 RepID=A0A101I2Y6_UNCT6|nr:MAG: 2-oxoglutarate ferredoxin oxidoreductase, beta subunit [candidate division TA06 bacterium 32_111]KUK87796.1 MAG: 2-oxoglutarate ferredoxin oxidoreductase, beta subunit [candidate division TA06 bacterium 34_109]MDI6700671.1 2-oxoacid:ferredoxin oxidoreductase subunit beta [bacterium]HAF07950.1 2-oxoacid:ferredoxin oxidoreductase subunit beta [candidate division WOR-3 bacterium]HCP16348.1 2-oxoacid:ferredoxin oxidoreductase subunit beta [candidate division WOR-3 bacterium]
MFNEHIFDYLRTDKLPHIWCPGCAHGIIVGSLVRSIEKLKIDKNKIAVLSGIGCSGRTPGYLDMNTLHTTHGRSLTFATGIKMAKPELTVIDVMGDGDAVAIGGNHFIHACRRNIDIKAIIFNNNIYGMTGGQYSPTTPTNYYASTAPYGNVETPFDIVKLAKGAGASFVARADAFHIGLLDNVIQKALSHKGFSVVEVMATCPTQFGRRNKMKEPYQMLDFVAERAISLKKWQEMSEEERKGKFPIGIFVDEQREEYVETYEKNVIERAKKGDR